MGCVLSLTSRVRGNGGDDVAAEGKPPPASTTEVEAAASSAPTSNDGAGARKPSKKKDVGSRIVRLGKRRSASSAAVASTTASSAALSSDFPRWVTHVHCSSLTSSFAASPGPVGWPAWLMEVAGEALQGWSPRRASSFQKLDKIGEGTYSNVYKARDLDTGHTVALKKVRFDGLEPASVRFMAREITLLRSLGDHPNVVKLQGIVISRVSCSLYLVFEYMEHDLTGLATSPDIQFSLPQIKCYMRQLLAGLEHCHSKGVLHRDIKGSNLLIDNNGVLKIADFGLAVSYSPENQQPMTSRVVTLWYRPPELLLGATNYGPEIDLWSAGCILAELLAKKPIMPGRTEVEQLHKIFKLCGTPTEQYWKKMKLQHAGVFKPQQSYRRCIAETFKDFPPSSLPLVETLLSIDPADRGTATSALESEFFTTEPLACEPSCLPCYPPSKEIDAKAREEESMRKRSGRKQQRTGNKSRGNTMSRVSRAVPAPEANAELQMNLMRRRMMARAEATSKSEKFPPPHQDGAMGVPSDTSCTTSRASFAVSDSSFVSSIFDSNKVLGRSSHGLKAAMRKNTRRADNRVAPSQQAAVAAGSGKVTSTRMWGQRRDKGKRELEVFGGGL